MKAMFAMAALLAAAGVQAADFPHVQPGMYEMHMKMDLPPELAAKLPPGMNVGDQTTRHCITPEQAADPYSSVNASKPHRSADKCEKPVMTMSGDKMIIDVKCEEGASHVESRFTSDGYEADILASSPRMPGGKMNMHVTAKRVGECN